MRNKNNEVQFEQPSDILLLVNRYLVITLAIIVIAILAIGYFFFLNPKISAISVVRQEDTVTQTNKEQNEKLLNKIKELETAFNGIKSDRQEDLDKLKMILPAEPQIAEMFVLADALAKEHGFELSSIDISEDKSTPVVDSKAIPANPVLGATATTSPETELKKAEVFPLKSLIVHLSITRPGVVLEEGEEENNSGETADVYQNFKDYVADLQKNLRLMDITTMSFGELTATGAETTVGFDLDIITYFRDNGQK